ncbi:nuclear pore complex protein Nup160 [Melospiza melodia melodia]|uniref:nuclear pore complex protein Nup160 n=1 Tax=Melospiza melodia melodia TaxID=1914991 RepID=UPI002FD3E913
MAAALAARSCLELSAAGRAPPRSPQELSFVPPGIAPLPAGRYSDSAGGFCYQESAQLGAATRNRWVRWSTSGDTVELVEESLDVNLLNNAVRLRIQGCPFLPGGIHLCEVQSHLVVLLLTAQTVHRLLLPHPARLYRSELITESQVQSVFTDISKIHIRDPSNYYVIPSVPGLAPNSVASAAWLSSEGEALFALPSASGGIFVLKLPPPDAPGSVSVVELKQSSVVQRFLTGWMPTAIRGDGGPSDVPVSLSVHCLDHDAFLFALCQDHKLRMWSYKDQMCLMVADLLEFMPVSRDLRLAAGTGHRLRLAFSQSLGLYLGVYMHAPKRGQFCVFQLVSTESNRYSLDHISSLFSSQETLVDFALTSAEIWALWHNEENQTVVKYINFEQNVAGQWNQVFVQPLPEEEVTVRQDQDPREIYLEYLFMPGRFTNAAIQKALQIFSQGTERHMDLTWDELRKEVTLAVENEFQGSVTEYECSPEEFWQLQVEFWSKFYACCLQYQEALSRPLALHLNPYTSMVCLLKKGSMSFLVPCSLVDHLYLLSNEHLLTEDDAAIFEDLEMSRDVVCLVQCLRLIGESISMEMAFIMEMACSRLQPPEKAAEQILEDLIANDTENVMEDIHSKLQEIRNPIHAIGLLIREMDYETDADMERAPHLALRMSLSQLFGSSTAAHVVCGGVAKICSVRFLLCRDLLILQQLLLRLGDPMVLGGGQLFQSQQDLLHRTSPLLLSYFLIRWASQRLASDVPVDTLESNLQHLSVLELADTTALTPHRLVSGPQTIVELFFQEVARKHIISRLFLQPNTSLAETSLNWPHLITSIVTDFLPLLWPSNPSFLFPECLMGSCQYTQLQEYIRLLQPWCHVNMGSCCFMMGRCYLVMGEGHKALDCFCQAASEVGREEFLDRLIQPEEGEVVSTPRLQYYNKVLRLLEMLGLPELVIELATLAIMESADDWRSQATLRTCIFKHHLDLGHNSDAYVALTQNPDPGRQLDCLRQLVVVLCERSQLQDLVEFPYVNLHNEVVGIIESHARAVDLMTHNYYELLYAFHVYRHNYRKAGTVMFEYGMRLGREVRTLRGLQKQGNCFLAAINCLRLIRPEYAWIVQPASGAVYERPGASPKRSHDGECMVVPSTRQIEILELEDLERECLLARIRLTLVEHDVSAAAVAGNSTPEETVSLLVRAGLFDSAITLCQTFKLPLTPIFEGLTFKCINLQLGGEAAQAKAWDWLAANQLSALVTTKESSATDEAWRLLSSYLERYPSQNSLYHRCVINKLLAHGIPLPNWLINSYKEVDAAELLRLYLNYDLLEEAVDLVLEYVDAVLGKGHQYFGIEVPLSPASPTMWLPYTAIDQLLQALRESSASENSVVLYEKLNDRMEDYQQKVSVATMERLYCRP